MASVRVAGLSLLLLALASATSVEEPPLSTTTAATSTLLGSSEPSATKAVVTSEKVARRIIDDRLSPPRTTEFSLWNKRLPPLGEIHHRLNSAPPRVTEDVDDNVTEKSVPKKTRTVGPTAGAQDPNCCGAEANKSLGDKDKSSQQLQDSDELDVERGSADGPAARFHGNRPYDDRYGSSGWKSSSYLGYGKDKNYYDQRNRYDYDRYGSVQRPSSNYAVDGDRYSAGQQRPSSSSTSGDRFGTASGDRFGTSGRPTGNYQAVGGGYGAYAGGSYRPSRPGGGYGISGSLDEPEGEYPFEGDAPGSPPGPNIANLQTQKAVALKALAGVALIGAAAALASNPVLLPISVISGRRRRKRSVEVESDKFALTALLQGYIQPKPNEVAESREDPKAAAASNSSSSSSTASQELVISPQCVARLACHVHRDYLDELDKSRAELQLATGTASANASDAEAVDAALGELEHWFDSLIHTNILVADYLSDELKSLIQSAVIVGSNRNETCDQFSCLNAKDQQKEKKPNDN